MVWVSISELDDAPEPRKCRLASATPNVSPPPPLGHLDKGKNYELVPLAGEKLETVLKMAAGEYEKNKVLTLAAWSAAQFNKLVRDLEHCSEPQPELRSKCDFASATPPPPRSSLLPSTSKLMLYSKLNSVLGPGGCLMGLADYEEAFGELTPDCPFGTDVWSGMMTSLCDKYMPTAKKAWHLSGAQVRCGWFNAPISFSKENSKLPPTFEDRRFGNCGRREIDPVKLHPVHFYW